MYADNQGEGTFAIPVVYFRSGIVIGPDDLPPMASGVQDAIDLGGVFGELRYSIDIETGELISPVSLYTNTAAEKEGSIYETPHSRGGSLVPIVYGEMGIGDDLSLIERVGSLHSWDENLYVLPLPLQGFTDYLGVDAMVFDIYAFDYDKADDEVGAVDLHLFGYNITEGTIESLMYQDDDEGENADDNAMGSEPTTSAAVGSNHYGEISYISGVLTTLFFCHLVLC